MATRALGIAAAKHIFPKTCFNPTCKCKELKIVREVTLRCSNCHCGVKVEELEMSKDHYQNTTNANLLFTVIKDGKDKS